MLEALSRQFRRLHLSMEAALCRWDDLRMNMEKTKIMVGGLDLDLLKRSGKVPLRRLSERGR